MLTLFAAMAVQPTCLPIQAGDGGTPVVQVRFNDSEPLNLVLDTGSSGTTIDPATADRLKLLRDTATETAQGMGGAVTVQFRRITSVTAGPLALNDVTLPSLPAPELNSHRIVGLAGTDLLGNHYTQWQPSGDCVLIGAGGSAPTGKGWRPVTTKWLQPWKIMLPIRIGKVDGWALLDTGAQFTTLSPGFAAAAGIKAAQSDVTMTGIDGRASSLSTAQIAAASIGPWAWRDERVQVGALPVFDRLAPAGDRLAILGMDWLAGRGFAVDYERKRVWLLAAKRSSNIAKDARRP